MLVTVKLILHLFLIGDGKLRKVQNSAPPPELPDSLLWDLKERDVDSLRGSVRRIKFEIKHHTSALVFTLFKTIKSFIHFITHTEFLESSIFSNDYFPPSSLLSFHIKWKAKGKKAATCENIVKNKFNKKSCKKYSAEICSALQDVYKSIVHII